MSEIRLVPVSFRDACAFVAMHHRHHLGHPIIDVPAAQAAALDAAWNAAGDAARNAVGAAAWNVTWDAAWNAAFNAAGAALAPTTAELQADAHRLVDRMLAVTGN